MVTLSATNIQTIGTVMAKPDFALLALLDDKGSGGAEQLIDTADFKTRWNIDDDTLVARLISLSTGKDPILKFTVDEVIVNWSAVPDIAMTEAQLKDNITTERLRDTRYITYTAIALNKTAAMTQTVVPADYETSRDLGGWGLSQATFLTELIAMAKSEDVNFTIDIPAVTVLWLKNVDSNV